MVDARALRFLISRLSDTQRHTALKPELRTLTLLQNLAVQRAKDQVFLPADFIICRGEIGNEMFFLREGCAGVFTCPWAAL